MTQDKKRTNKQDPKNF